MADRGDEDQIVARAVIAGAEVAQAAAVARGMARGRGQGAAVREVHDGNAEDAVERVVLPFDRAPQVVPFTPV